MKAIAVLLADGFEEIEAITVIDMLRRAAVPVKTLSITDSTVVCGAHQIPVIADDCLANFNADELNGVVLPGGLPGSTNLAASEEVLNLIAALNQQKKLVAAICAAPTVLAKANILQYKTYTCYPGCEAGITQGTRLEEPVVIHENVITGRAPGAAIAFAEAIIQSLTSTITSTAVIKGMIL